ncbi:MAG: lipocalin-like domain-containing protein [Pseudomonadota bacterium]
MNRITYASCLFGVATLLGGCGDPPAVSDNANVTAFLGQADDAEQFARATTVRDFAFPADHGAHPRFRTEWWYLTGHLRDTNNRHFGMQLTFFRFALPPSAERRSGSMASDQLWMAHAAITDTDGNAFYTAERLQRGALGMAGVTASPFRVSLDDWSMASTGETLFPMALKAGTDQFSLDLTAKRGKPLVLQGDRGLDAKGAEPGNASYYYSYTRLPATGRVSIAGTNHEVAGTIWMDREWSTSVLGDNVEGWNWFALQLDNGHDLMVYRLRQKDGSTSPFSGGVVVDPAGNVIARLSAEQIALEPIASWTSPVSGARYEVSWQLGIEDLNIALQLTPVIENQELNLTVRYWEGALNVAGSYDGSEVGGMGYAEHAGVSAAR